MFTPKRRRVNLFFFFFYNPLHPPQVELNSDCSLLLLWLVYNKRVSFYILFFGRYNFIIHRYVIFETHIFFFSFKFFFITTQFFLSTIHIYILRYNSRARKKNERSVHRFSPASSHRLLKFLSSIYSS